MHLWVYNMQLPPYKPYNPCDGRQETVTIPSKPRDVQHTVCSRDGLHPSITCILYGCNHIRLRWPALLWRMMDGCKRDGCSIGQEGCRWRMDARGTVAQLGKRDADDGWMQDGRLLNWARGTWMMDGWMPNWVEGCFHGRKGCSIG